MSAPDDYFREKIEEQHKKLKALFGLGIKNQDREAFQEMGRLIGEHTVLGTPQGQRITGGEAIGLYFENLAKSGHFALEFVLKFLWVSPTLDPVPTKVKTDIVVEVGYFIAEFRLHGNPSEKVGGLCGALVHIGGCPIIP